jgi:hypothetical protein
MKKILLILILSIAGYHASAQQKSRTKYMIITITSANLKLNMIVTREDSTQIQRHLELNPKVKAKDELAAHEKLILQTLKPYFDNGWKLLSTSTEMDVNFGQSTGDLTRFFLSKEE